MAEKIIVWKEEEATVKFTANVVITSEAIEDIMLSALSGISYWADNIGCVGKQIGDDVCEHVANGGAVEIHLTEGEIEEGGSEWFKLDKDMLLKGIQMYLDDEEKPYEIVDFNGIRYEIDLGNVDGAVADLIVQYALFGEEVFA